MNITCSFCQGTMEIYQMPKYNRVLVAIFITLGVLFSLSIAGLLLGLLLLFSGLYMAYAKKEVWYCDSCKAIVNRLDPKKELKKAKGSCQQPETQGTMNAAA